MGDSFRLEGSRIRRGKNDRVPGFKGPRGQGAENDRIPGIKGSRGQVKIKYEKTFNISRDADLLFGLSLSA